MTLVDHLIYRDEPPLPRGLAYDYVLAGDGLFLVAENAFLSVRVPVASCTVRGLPPLFAACTLKHGLLPGRIWKGIEALARASTTVGREAFLAVTHHPDVGYRLEVPRQSAGPENVFYEPLTEAVLEVHTHCDYAARFSATDGADEQRLCLYGVVGRLEGDRPEVSIRVGAYGYFMSLPWRAVFAGERGTFRDAGLDPVKDEEALHGLFD